MLRFFRLRLCKGLNTLLPVPESRYRRVPRHMPQYPWQRKRASALAASLFAGNTLIFSFLFKFCALAKVAVVGTASRWNWKWSRSFTTSVTAIYEQSHKNSPDSMSVSSCRSGSNTIESPVTRRESFRRVRSEPACVCRSRVVESQRRANTFCRLKKNLTKKVSYFETYRTLCWNIFLIRNESFFGSEGIWAAHFDGRRRRGGGDLQWPPECLQLVCRPWSACYKCSSKPWKEINTRSSRPPTSSTSFCDSFSPRLFSLNFAAERRPMITINTDCHANASHHFQANQDTAHTCRDREFERDFSLFPFVFWLANIFLSETWRERKRGMVDRYTKLAFARLRSRLWKFSRS